VDRVYVSKCFGQDLLWKITANAAGITGIMPVKNDFLPDENDISAEAAAQLEAYFLSAGTRFDVPLSLSGTPFQQQVWNALRQIPYGHTVSYGELAAKIGRPGAAQAVGQAVGRNPCLIVVPCHRVLGKDGALTGFSAGLELKRNLLRMERIPFVEKRRT